MAQEPRSSTPRNREPTVSGKHSWSPLTRPGPTQSRIWPSQPRKHKERSCSSTRKLYHSLSKHLRAKDAINNYGKTKSVDQACSRRGRTYGHPVRSHIELCSFQIMKTRSGENHLPQTSMLQVERPWYKAMKRAFSKVGSKLLAESGLELEFPAPALGYHIHA